jgi:MYXO-CTERM domain-containing protein
MRHLAGIFGAGAFAGVLAFCAPPARADWPMARHDAQRTAAATGHSDLTSPVPTWRFPVGSSLWATHLVVGDVDGDKQPELIYVRGHGAVFASRLDGSLLWRTPAITSHVLQGLADLDGDGRNEVISTAHGAIAAISGATGTVGWYKPSGDFNTITRVLIGDITGDGLADVVLRDCIGCDLPGKVPGLAYSFAGGLSSPKQLWQLPPTVLGAEGTTILLDSDGDGRSEVLLGRDDGFDLLDGISGLPVAALAYGKAIHQSGCVPAPLSGKGEVAFCVFAWGTSDDSGHKVFAVRRTGGALSLLWEQKVGSVDGAIAYKPGFVADLDGDGSAEVVVHAATSATAWSTFVLDAATGAVLATIADHKLIGTAQVLAGGRRLIFVEEANGASAWVFKRGAAPAVTQAFALSGAFPESYRDEALARRSMLDTALLALDLNGDGTPDLVTRDLTDGSLRVLDTSQGAPKTLGIVPMAGSSYASPLAPGRVGGRAVLFAAWTDGLIRAYGGSSAGVSEVLPGVPYDALDTADWFGAPVVARLAAGAPERALVVDVEGTMHALDGSHADASTPPAELWSMPHTVRPMVVPQLAGGAPAVVAMERLMDGNSPHHEQLVARRGDGSLLWASPVDGGAATDLVYGHVDADGVPDVLVQWGDASSGFYHSTARLVSGATGATISETPLTGTYYHPGLSLHDWNGDGVDDVFEVTSGVRVTDGATGASIGPSPAPAGDAACAVAMIADVDGDGAAEVVVEGCLSHVAVVSSDLGQVLWASTANQPSGGYGALARCPSGLKLVEGTLNYHTSRLTLTNLTPPALGTQTVLYLVGGNVWPSEDAAVAAGGYPGDLTVVSLHEDLTGLGHPTAVMGSSDGFLYGLDPCTGNLDFAYDFGDAVASASFGDTDGDGRDEMIVTVSDGYVYDLKQPSVGGGGTGGTSSTTTSSSSSTLPTGGAGGVGGAGGTGGATGTFDPIYITGRATCFCTAAGTGDDGSLGAVALSGLAAVIAARRRRRG